MNRLPDLHQAPLDDETLDALFQDIATFGKEIEVTPKWQARREVGDASMTLNEAHAALRERSLHGAQIRYTFQGQSWCDTLVRALEGWQLTRINLDLATERSTA
jgi:hypothetical protein